ncbi:hypothetical protein [Kutzneria buriramensis]|uniref:Uncharacterized protein n=1 Tax=Kutzneria buriramensis TaxID=1045776 RepID=A0A3E0HIK2_9PSEU|nr:hypothetical protein [Kutzneria buriramensis]REH46238.1 hypothetical protein BCF44_107371 [Kutzneria buriramensis]
MTHPFQFLGVQPPDQAGLHGRTARRMLRKVAYALGRSVNRVAKT